MHLFFFSNDFPSGDVGNGLRTLYTHAKHARCRRLREFLDGAIIAFRNEVNSLPQHQRTGIRYLESFQDLYTQKHLLGGSLRGAIEGALLVVLQVGHLISSLDDKPELFASTAQDRLCAGLGIGQLAAAALAVSTSTPKLCLAGTEAVRCAFRLGVLVSETSLNLEACTQDGCQDSWAYVVTDLDQTSVQVELDKLNEHLTAPSRLFVSATNDKSVTVSGPPTQLKVAFRKSEVLRYSAFAPLPVYSGLCHAPHIYNSAHASKILDTTGFRSLEGTNAVSGVIVSTATGRPLVSTSTKALFEDTLLDIMTRSIHAGKITSGIVSLVSSGPIREHTICSYKSNKDPFADTKRQLEQAMDSCSQVDLLSWTDEVGPEGSAPKSAKDVPIAIVGMACRFPGGADDLDLFWDLLEKGRDVHKRIPADRFDVEAHYDPLGKAINSTPTPYGCFIDEPGLFDAAFFNMSAREALETDPMHRLALVTAYEALERAGYVPNSTPASDVKRVGTFYGQASDDYREVNTAQDIGTYFIPGGCRAFAPGRISYHFGFWGPSFSCDTACSSSLATIQAACTSLWARDADTIVAGGLNVLTNPDAFAGLGRGHFLSGTGSCKTWDSGADGYCRADGVGSIILKRLDDAQADNDNILGVVLAAATNHSGDAISITHPHAEAQAELFTKVLNRAAVDSNDVSYVEFHGTGTQAGDATEMESVLGVFAPSSPKRNANAPLYIGAVKSNVGHGEAAAGIMALIKVLCMLQQDKIPPHVGIKTTINPALPVETLDRRNVHIPYEATVWSQATQGRARIAVVNNFSAAGGNTTLLLREAPPKKAILLQDSRASHVVCASAKSRTSLRGNIQSLLAYLDQNSDVSLADLSYTTCARRMHHSLRIAVTATDRQDLMVKLAAALGSTDSVQMIQNTASQAVAYSFTGQGSMYLGAGRQLYCTSPAFANGIDQCNRFCILHDFPEISGLFDGTASEDDLTPMMTNLAIVCIGIALSKFWASLGLRPSIVVGHSLGEYAALYTAGVLSASDAIYLVGKRAQLISQSCEEGSHLMMAVKATVAQIDSCLAQVVPFEYACKNSDDENVIAGDVTCMETARESLTKQGIRCHELRVPFAFHSAQMDPMLEEFEQLAERVVFKAPNIPVISPLRTKIVYDAKTFNARYLRDATRHTVDFTSSVNLAERMQIVDNQTTWIELGAHPICTKFVSSAMPHIKTTVSSLNRHKEDWVVIAEACAHLHAAGVYVDWAEYYRSFEGSHQLLDLPRYSWNNKNYWIQYEGSWALDKGKTIEDSRIAPVAKSPFSTSSVHRIVDQKVVSPGVGNMVVESDVMHPDFLQAAWGHKMNNHAVVTSSIHADIAFTIGTYMHKQLDQQGPCHMNLANLDVKQGLIANKDQSKSQVIQIKASTDLRASRTDLYWYNVGEDEHFASAQLLYGNDEIWLKEWDRIAHLVLGRVRQLQVMEREGVASKLSKSMAYRLFANLVDYSEKYRGMQNVIIHELEAVATVRLCEESSGVWTIPPWFIDSVCHLAGFIMNGGDATDTQDSFFVTPGWESMRFAKPLVAGGQYQSYVMMRPTEPGFWAGDVYILQDNMIIGMVGGIIFRRFPRLLLDKLFTPPDLRSSLGGSSAKTVRAPTVQVQTPVKKTLPSPAIFDADRSSQSDEVSTAEQAPPSEAKHSFLSSHTSQAAYTPATSQTTMPQAASSSVASPPSRFDDVLAIIAREAAIDSLAELSDDAAFMNLGIDSLLSLVLSEKFKEELGVQVSGAQFLECPTVGEFKAWFNEHY